MLFICHICTLFKLPFVSSERIDDISTTSCRIADMLEVIAGNGMAWRLKESRRERKRELATIYTNKRERRKGDKI